MYFSAFFILTAINSITASKQDVFTEELLLKPLYSEQLYAHFQFSTIWNTNPEEEDFRHTHLFPRALGEIIKRYNVQELHVSLTGGLWRYESWGYPVFDAAPGGEIWAWFRDDTENIDKNWKELAGSLSGLLCASLNFVDTSTSISPEFTFKPVGVVGFNQRVNTSYLRYSSLPREIVCTENLTPWKKLLPCESKSGLASLLNSGYIHNTRYHSIALHLRPICANAACNSISFELKQSISLVYDYAILGTKNWSFSKLFGQGILNACPLANSSTVYVDVTSNSSVSFELIPAPDETFTSYRGGQVNKYAKYSVKPYPTTINANYFGKNSISLIKPPPIYANQYVTGYGHERGGIVTKIYNHHWASLDVVVLQNIPWYVPIYLHTLTVHINKLKTKPKLIRYVPGKTRQRPYYIELLLTLPPRSTASISIDFDYVFLKWQEYPPDANHGFYIGSAIVSTYLPLAKNFTGLPLDATTISESFNASRSGYLVQVRTENMVITLPTPDFSMPYNVICLACTVVALAFGPLHNITTKRLILKSKNQTGFVTKIRNLIQGFLGRGGNKCGEVNGSVDGGSNQSVQSQ